MLAAWAEPSQRVSRLHESQILVKGERHRAGTGRSTGEDLRRQAPEDRGQPGRVALPFVAASPAGFSRVEGVG
jgi:hypothetical protein